MTLAIGALPFAPNILIDPLLSSLFYLSFYSMVTLFILNNISPLLLYIFAVIQRILTAGDGLVQLTSWY